jgi:hypothetical protein
MLVACSLLAVASLVLIGAPWHAAPPPAGIISPAASTRELTHRLAQADPDSPQAAQLRQALKKVRRKSQQTEATQEDPGALAEALAELKTAPDGTTYPPNYKITQLALAKRNKRVDLVPRPWIERGPGNVAGRARAVVVDPTDATHRTWLVATVGGGIWKTTDGGVTWSDKTPELQTLSTTCLAMCASHPDVLYAGTGMGYGRIVDLEGSGVWKSIDRGETWTQLSSTANGQVLAAINRIVVDPDDPDVVVLCSNDTFSRLGPKGGERISGIFRSTDGGVSWTQTFDPEPLWNRDNRVQQIVATPGNFDVLYATVNEVGVIKSIDAGQTWTVSADDFALLSDIGNPPGGAQSLAGISVRTEMAIAPSDPQRLYAAVERPRGVGDLYMSTDAGATWQLLDDTGGDPNWFNAFGQSGAIGAYTAGWFDNTLVVHPYDENVVFLGGVNLYRATVDVARAERLTEAIAWWIPNAQGLPVVHADHHWLEAIPLDAGSQSFWLVDANDGGVGVSLNGGVSWTQSTGQGTTQFYGADRKRGANAYIGGMQDNGTWHSGPNATAQSNWFSDIGGDGFEAVWNYRDSDLMLGGSQYGNLARSDDGGIHWFPARPANLGNAPFITKIANSKADPDLVFTVDAVGVHRSDDFGATWTRTAITGSWLGYRPFTNVEVSNAQPQVVWITSRISLDPATGRRGGIHVSTDGGLSFAEITESLPLEMTESSGLGTSALEPGRAYLLFAAPGLPKVLRTEDYGQTFEDISGFTNPAKTSNNGFPDVATFALLEMPYDPQVLWAGTEIGLFVSEDSGVSWTFADDSLPHVAIFELSIVEDQVIAATQGRGVWSVTMPELEGYEPPVVALAPRLSSLGQSPSGPLEAVFDLRSPYDETRVMVNGALAEILPANEAPQQIQRSYPVTQDETIIVSMASFKDGVELKAPPRSTQVYTTVATNRYVQHFNATISATADFELRGFTVSSTAGFATPLLHSSHPYPVNTDLTATLKHPIRVDAADPTLTYKDVAIVEEGTVSDWTDPNFYDYVVVEGTSDGVTWRPLAPGYDARLDPAWLSRYRSGLNGASSVFVSHTLDLTDTFDPGDLVFLRFRLHSDPSVTGWGWGIDDLVIQGSAVPVVLDDEPGDDALPARISLDQNHPNPFNPVTSIRYSVPRSSRVRLVVYDVAGRKVCTLVDREAHETGKFLVEWRGVDDSGHAVASGVYVYRLETDHLIRSKKMTLLR